MKTMLESRVFAFVLSLALFAGCASDDPANEDHSFSTSGSREADQADWR